MNTASLSTFFKDASTWTAANRPVEIVLEESELHTWNGSHMGMTIRACEGCVWITQEGDAQDVILATGQSFRITRPGKVIAESLVGRAKLLASSSGR